MKTFLRFASVICLMCSSLISNAYTFEVDGIYYTRYGDEVVVVSHDTFEQGLYSGDVVIPQSVTYDNVTYSVTAIGGDAFYDCPELNSVFIPRSIKQISYNPFTFCPRLKAINVASDNEFFCSEQGVLFSKDRAQLLAFPGGKVAEYVVPGSVTEIGQDAFRDCDSLVSVTLPDGLIKIAACAFECCDKIQAIEIPATVTDIGMYAFADCSSLQQASIHNQLIGKMMFQFCGNLSQVDLGENLTTIGERAFRSSGLTSVNIPANVTSVGDGAFGQCMQLNAATIGCATISRAMFAYCKSLTSVQMLDNVKTIGEGAFSSCSQLPEITLGSGVTSIGGQAFMECTALRSAVIPGSLRVLTFESFWRCTSLETVHVGEGVQEIQTAFKECPALAHNNIPASVSKISTGAFGACLALQGFDVASDNQYFSERDGVLFNKAGTALLIYPNSHGAHYSIPDGTTTIEQNAFGGCKRLESVTIPNSVTLIGDYAFVGCGITHIDLPQTITTLKMGTFSACSNLEEIDIPPTVTQLGEYCFASCSSLRRVGFPPQLTVIPLAAFEGCSSLKAVVLPDALTKIESWAFCRCDTLNRVDIPSGVNYIPGSAFYFCDDLTTVICRNPIPPVCESCASGAFGDTKRDTLCVPRVALDAYRNASEWKRFAHIVPIEGDYDVTSDRKVDIADVNVLISGMLCGNAPDWYDLNDDSQVDIADVNVVINAMLGK